MKCRVMLLGVLMSLLVFGCSGDKQVEYIQHYEDFMKRESEERQNNYLISVTMRRT